MLNKRELANLYIQKQLSATEIARLLSISDHKVRYWLTKHKIKIRSMSDAIYAKHNPNGDPFVFQPPITSKDYYLWGLGIGLYWGEGNKANKNTIRIGNSDAHLLKIFIKFLDRFFGVERSQLKAHIHLFSDLDLNKAQKFWENSLGLKSEQFFKPTVTLTGKLGNYRKKSEFGVLTLYFCNIKARNILIENLPR